MLPPESRVSPFVLVLLDEIIEATVFGQRRMGRHERARQEGPEPGGGLDEFKSIATKKGPPWRKGRVAASGRRRGELLTDREAMMAILTAARAARAAKR